MSTKFEAAVRAVYETVIASTKGLSLHPETCAAVVRAVLEVIREPDEAMEKAGQEVGVSHAWGSPPNAFHSGEYITDPDSIWTAMIDVLLAEARGGK